MNEYVRVCTGMYEYVRVCTSTYDYVRVRTSMYEYVRACTYILVKNICSLLTNSLFSMFHKDKDLHNQEF